MKPLSFICRAMFVQNIVRRAVQAPALARTISSTAPKPSNLPAREYLCHYQLVSLVMIWLIWWCLSPCLSSGLEQCQLRGHDRAEDALITFNVQRVMSISKLTKLTIFPTSEFLKIKEKQKAWKVDNGLRVHEVTFPFIPCSNVKDKRMTSIFHKVNRCLARYSPRATTTNRPTNRALNKPAWPGPK